MVQDKQVNLSATRVIWEQLLPTSFVSTSLKTLPTKKVRWLSVTWRASNEHWVVNQPSVQPRNRSTDIRWNWRMWTCRYSLKYFAEKAPSYFVSKKQRLECIELKQHLPVQGRTITIYDHWPSKNLFTHPTSKRWSKRLIVKKHTGSTHQLGWTNSLTTFLLAVCRKLFLLGISIRIQAF